MREFYLRWISQDLLSCGPCGVKDLGNEALLTWLLLTFSRGDYSWFVGFEGLRLLVVDGWLVQGGLTLRHHFSLKFHVGFENFLILLGRKFCC